jgi:hypothetical protein
MYSRILLQIGLYLPIKSLISYHLVYRLNDYFWELRMKQDFPKIYQQLKLDEIKISDYKIVYKNNYGFKDKISKVIYFRPEFVGQVQLQLKRGDAIVSNDKPFIYDGTKNMLPFTSIYNSNEIVNPQFRIIEEFELNFCKDLVGEARFAKLYFYFNPIPYLDQIIKNERKFLPEYKSKFYDFRSIERYVFYKNRSNLTKDSTWRVFEYNVCDRVYKYALLLVED